MRASIRGAAMGLALLVGPTTVRAQRSSDLSWCCAAGPNGRCLTPFARHSRRSAQSPAPSGAQHRPASRWAEHQGHDRATRAHGAAALIEVATASRLSVRISPRGQLIESAGSFKVVAPSAERARQQMLRPRSVALPTVRSAGLRVRNTAFRIDPDDRCHFFDYRPGCAWRQRSSGPMFSCDSCNCSQI